MFLLNLECPKSFTICIYRATRVLVADTTAVQLPQKTNHHTTSHPDPIVIHHEHPSPIGPKINPHRHGAKAAVGIIVRITRTSVMTSVAMTSVAMTNVTIAIARTVASRHPAKKMTMPYIDPNHHRANAHVRRIQTMAQRNRATIMHQTTSTDQRTRPTVQKNRSQTIVPPTTIMTEPFQSTMHSQWTPKSHRQVPIHPSVLLSTTKNQILLCHPQNPLLSNNSSVRMRRSLRAIQVWNWCLCATTAAIANHV